MNKGGRPENYRQVYRDFTYIQARINHRLIAPARGSPLAPSHRPYGTVGLSGDGHATV